MTNNIENWNRQKARSTYNFPAWSGGYFDVSENGTISICTDPDHPENCADLYQVTHSIINQGLDFPVLVRFPDILLDRISRLQRAFSQAMTHTGYEGNYVCVYPVKVNQQRNVIQKIITAPTPVGLEAGSKPELLATLAFAPPNCTIICNGYKDREFIRLALISQSLGHPTYIVIEKMSELFIALEEAERLNIPPQLGIRIRLASIGNGNWQNSGGERSKFGLTPDQVISCVEHLESVRKLDCLKLIHFHLGSQIPNINDIKTGVREAARFYVELHKLGADITTVDVGGGLGIDYDGTRSRSYCSINYSIDEYSLAIVQSFFDTCHEHQLPHPHIITESGRAITAHHAVLITNVVNIDQRISSDIAAARDPEQHPVLSSLAQLLDAIGQRPLIEIYHELIHLYQELQTLFAVGQIGLAERASGESLYLSTCRSLLSRLSSSRRSHLEISDELHDRLADKFFCNLSIFQSMPDIWGIDQLFPVAPLHHLDTAPDRHAVLYDLTCDSDGHIEYYVGEEEISRTLPLHYVEDDYLLGFFLVGAYQETLGDIHNLFGDTHSVDVTIGGNGEISVTNIVKGDSARKVLSQVQLDGDELLNLFKTKLNQVPIETSLRNHAETAFSSGLNSYTYLLK